MICSFISNSASLFSCPARSHPFSDSSNASCSPQVQRPSRHSTTVMIDERRPASSFKFDDESFNSSSSFNEKDGVDSFQQASSEDRVKAYDIFKEQDGRTPELDALLLDPNAPEDVILAQNRILFPDDDSFTKLEGTVHVTLSIPLGVVLEELPSGELYVDEVEEEGNARKTGALQPGDVIVATSLPVGSDLTTIPTEDALDFIEEIIKSRAQEDNSISFAVRRGGDVETFRRECYENANPFNPEKVEEILELLNSDWYPLISDDDDEDESPAKSFVRRKEKLVEDGLDMDVEVGYIPNAKEIAEAELKSENDMMTYEGYNEDDIGKDDFEGDIDLQESTKHWKELYEKRKKKANQE